MVSPEIKNAQPTQDTTGSLQNEAASSQTFRAVGHLLAGLEGRQRCLGGMPTFPMLPMRIGSAIGGAIEGTLEGIRIDMALVVAPSRKCELRALFHQATQPIRAVSTISIFMTTLTPSTLIRCTQATCGLRFTAHVS